MAAFHRRQIRNRTQISQFVAERTIPVRTAFSRAGIVLYACVVGEDFETPALCM